MDNEAYSAIAGVYDKLNAEIDYAAWADFLEACFARYLPGKPEIVLDLACGTGRMTTELARRGYDMIGVDASEDMLSVAVDSTCGLPGILYLRQDMRRFELYGTVGAVCSCLDSVNYLTDEKDLRDCFATVHNYLDPDGLFLFDVNTPYKFEHIYGDNAYILESEQAGRGIYCGWQNFYDAHSGLCEFDLTVFRENAAGTWTRAEETQTERCYTREALTDALNETGFDVLGVFGDWQFSPPDEHCERWYFVARAKKPQEILPADI